MLVELVVELREQRPDRGRRRQPLEPFRDGRCGDDIGVQLAQDRRDIARLEGRRACRGVERHTVESEAIVELEQRGDQRFVHPRCRLGRPDRVRCRLPGGERRDG